MKMGNSGEWSEGTGEGRGASSQEIQLLLEYAY